MSFAGYHLTSKSKTAIETAQSELAHLSRVCLTEYETPCKYQVRIEDDNGKSFCLGVLTDRYPQIELEHYVQNGTKVWLEGKGDAKADLTGYVEPTYSFSDAEDDEDDEDICCDGEMSSDSEAVEAEKSGDSSTNDNFPSMNASEESEEDQDTTAEAAEGAAVGIASSSSEENDDDDDDDDDNDDDDSDDEDDDADEAPAVFDSAADSEEASSSEEEVTEIVNKKQPKKEDKKDAPAPADSSKKRKADRNVEAPPAKKKSTPDTEYERILVEELKRVGGRTKISLLGAKVPRPAGITAKLGIFLKERSQSFVVDGQTVSLHPSLVA